MVDYRFLRTFAGQTRFAKATVVSVASHTWSVELSKQVGELAPLYGSAIASGVERAVAEQNRRKQPPYTVSVLNIVESPADTSADAIECAVAVAAWKSFGGEEQDISIDFEEGRWKVSFKPTRDPTS